MCSLSATLYNWHCETSPQEGQDGKNKTNSKDSHNKKANWNNHVHGRGSRDHWMHHCMGTENYLFSPFVEFGQAFLAASTCAVAFLKCKFKMPEKEIGWKSCICFRCVKNQNINEHIINGAEKEPLPIKQIILSPLWLIATINKNCAQVTFLLL